MTPFRKNRFGKLREGVFSFHRVLKTTGKQKGYSEKEYPFLFLFYEVSLDILQQLCVGFYSFGKNGFIKIKFSTMERCRKALFRVAAAQKEEHTGNLGLIKGEILRQHVGRCFLISIAADLL